MHLLAQVLSGSGLGHAAKQSRPGLQVVSAVHASSVLLHLSAVQASQVGPVSGAVSAGVSAGGTAVSFPAAVVVVSVDEQPTARRPPRATTPSRFTSFIVVSLSVRSRVRGSAINVLIRNRGSACTEGAAEAVTMNFVPRGLSSRPIR